MPSARGRVRFEQALLAFVLPLGLCGVGRRARPARLCDCDVAPDIGLVEPRDDATLLHPVPFVGRKLGNEAGDSKRQRNPRPGLDDPRSAQLRLDSHGCDLLDPDWPRGLGWLDLRV